MKPNLSGKNTPKDSTSTHTLKMLQPRPNAKSCHSQSALSWQQKIFGKLSTNGKPNSRSNGAPPASSPSPSQLQSGWLTPNSTVTVPTTTLLALLFVCFTASQFTAWIVWSRPCHSCEIHSVTRSPGKLTVSVCNTQVILEAPNGELIVNGEPVPKLNSNR